LPKKVAALKVNDILVALPANTISVNLN